jgi:zona occludens toxin (predicted ATPase)
MAVRHWALWRKGTHGGQKDMTSTLMFTHGRRRGKSKNVCSAWANRKLSLIATMAFLEFRLSGFETASKPRAFGINAAMLDLRKSL